MTGHLGDLKVGHLMEEADTLLNSSSLQFLDFTCHGVRKRPEKRISKSHTCQTLQRPLFKQGDGVVKRLKHLHDSQIS